jgi:membrane protein required for colicin V production
MDWLDIVLIVILAGATLGGLIIGLIVAAFALAGIIAGIVLAGHYYIPLSQHLSFFSSESVAQVVAFIIILLGVMLVAAALAFILRWVAKLVKLGWIDRLGGAVFGLITGALLCAAVLALWVKFAGAGTAITGSVLASVLLDGFPIILGLLPAEFDAVSAFFQ